MATGYDPRSKVLFIDGSFGKNVIIFGADMSSSVRIDNKGIDILILRKGPTQGLDDSALTTEAIYPINFKQPDKVYNIMEATACFLLMLQKYINSTQKTQKEKIMHCV